jgi:hypothetical protein
LKPEACYATLSSIFQSSLGPRDPPARTKDPSDLQPCILPGILALPGDEQESIQALLTETALPKFSASHVKPRYITAVMIMDWARTAEPAFQEALETLVDYLIEITSNTYISDHYSALTPFITKWASQVHSARMIAIADMDRSKTFNFQGTQANELQDLTHLFIQDLREILIYFEPGNGPIALLGNGKYVQVPHLSCVGDRIFTFAGREETFILRPEQVKEDPESEKYIVKDFYYRGALGDPFYPMYNAERSYYLHDQRLRHFKYVAYDNRIWDPKSFKYLPVRHVKSTGIPTTVILH